jgi:hypothetical protein
LTTATISNTPLELGLGMQSLHLWKAGSDSSIARDRIQPKTQKLVDRFDSGENPHRNILLLGSARSGTSWSLAILNSHPNVLGCNEPFKYMRDDASMQECMQRLLGNSPRSTDKGRLVEWLKVPYPETHKGALSQKSFYRYSRSTRFAAWVIAKFVPGASDVYRTVARPVLSKNDYLVIKNSIFPGMNNLMQGIASDVIVLMRHPCAVASSWMRGIDLGLMPKPDPNAMWQRYTDILEGLGYDQTKMMSCEVVELLALNWLVEALQSDQLAGQFRTTTLVYEDVLLSPKTEWKRVFDWLGISFHEDVSKCIDDTSTPRWNIRKLWGDRGDYFSVNRLAKRSSSGEEPYGLSTSLANMVMSTIRPHYDLSRYWKPLGT